MYTVQLFSYLASPGNLTTNDRGPPQQFSSYLASPGNLTTNDRGPPQQFSSYLASPGNLPIGIPHFIPDYFHPIVYVHCQKGCINTGDIARHLQRERGEGRREMGRRERGDKTGLPHEVPVTSQISFNFPVWPQGRRERRRGERREEGEEGVKEKKCCLGV